MGQVFACLFEALEIMSQTILQGTDLNDYSSTVIAVADTLEEKLPQVRLDPPVDTSRELNNLVVEMLREFFSDANDEARAAAAERDRAELLTTTELGPERLGRLCAFSWPITLVCFYVIIDIFLPLFRIHWTDEQFDDFIRGLELALPDADLETVILSEFPELEPIDYEEYYLPEGYNDFGDEEAEDGESEDEDFVGVEYRPNTQQYTPIGQPIPLGEFCLPIASPVGFDDVDCNICGNGLTVIETGDEAVVTVCMHYFHAMCLSAWVNDSGARNSNNCPHCRTRMCGRRPRTRVVEISEDGSDDDDNAQDEVDDDDVQDEIDGSEDENDGSEDEGDGSEDEGDGSENRQAALREYIMQYRAAVPPAGTPPAAVTL